MLFAIQASRLFTYIFTAILLVNCGGGSGGEIPSSAPLPKAQQVNNVQVTNNSNGSVKISWDVTPELLYKVYISTDNGKTVGLITKKISGSEFNHKNAPTNIPLNYTVTASGAKFSDSDQSLLTSTITIKPKLVTLSASEHNCFVKMTGTLWCWGKNDVGQLGNGIKSRAELPVQEKTLAKDWAQVAVGFNHTCAIKINGDLYCWGEISEVSVKSTDPNASKTDLSIPNIIVGSQNWVKVSLGKNLSCGIKSDSKLYCWSGRPTPTGGIIRIDPLPPYADSKIPAVFTDQANQEMTGWSDISIGRQHVCAIQTVNNESKLLCWGDRLRGQLADNNAADTSTVNIIDPVIENSQSINWYKVHAGEDYTCGIKRDNSLWCWGANSFGQLGINDTTKTDQHTPQQVNTNGTVFNNWTEIITGTNHTCGIQSNAAENRIYCWGKNTFGQIGDKTLVDVIAPTQAGGLTDIDWKNIALGNNHTCAIKQDNSLYCWGSRDFNNVADISGSATAPTQIGTATDWNKIEAGKNYTFGIIMNGGKRHSWGQNNFAQLNNGSKTNMQTIGTSNGTGKAWPIISAGENHVCGTFSIFSQNQVTTGLNCWGDDTYQQLGIYAENNSRAIPSPAPGNNWSEISSGGKHTCGIQATKLWCWGDNTFGQIGNNSTNIGPFGVTEIKHPDAATQWKSVSTGYDFTCAIDNSANSKIYCWGNNTSNQLAIKVTPTTQKILLPTLAEDNKVSPSKTILNNSWVKIKSGRNHSCALKTNGELFCWGNNNLGKVRLCSYKIVAFIATSPNSDIICETTTGFEAYNILSFTTTPDTWLDFAVGYGHTCAIRQSDSSLWCRGDNAYSQRGQGVNDFLIDTNQEKSKSTMWNKVVAGKNHTCAIKATVAGAQFGTLWCWGQNTFGQLGTGTAWSEAPTLIKIP